MQINIMAIGKRMPAWIEAGFLEYSKRFPSDYRLQLIEVAQEKSSNQNESVRLEREAQKLRDLIPNFHHTIALDVKGITFTTPQLAQKLNQWQQNTSQLNFVIGGPEGLAKSFLDEVGFRWSLSPLTLPHPLVRIVLIEQLYRAITLLKGHPYHRE